MSDQFRYELKFVLNERQLIQIRSWIAAETRASPRYQQRLVNSLYYDTADLRSLKDNLYGIADRTKHRLRWYGNGRSNDTNSISLEVKRRTGRLNSKHRVALPELADSIGGDSHYQIRENLMRLVHGIQGFERLAMYFPTMQIQYSREYFEDVYGLRITLDQDIGFYLTPLNENLYFGQGIQYPWCVMEIKFPRDLKSNVSQTMRRLKISPKRHSKYAAGLAAFGQATYF